MLLEIVILLSFACQQQAAPSTDPCLVAQCPFGSICIRSIDGISYNCVQESTLVNSYSKVNSESVNFDSQRPKQTTNNYFEKYLTFSPCMSSPCMAREICRNLPQNQYVCQQELESTKNIAPLPVHIAKNKHQVWNNIQNIWKNRVNNNERTRLTSLAAVSHEKQNRLRDEDYDEKTPEELQTLLGNICKDKKSGSKHINPNRINQYLICLSNESFILRNCQRGYVFNTFSSDCEKTRDMLGEHFNTDSNPCLNNSTFLPIDNFKYRCDCPVGFTGKNCEHADICQPSFCGESGVCLGIGHQSEYTHLCWCNNGLEIGQNCKEPLLLEPNPCMSFNRPDREFYSLALTPSVFVKCVEENKPILDVCQYPLIFSEKLQECSWKR